MLNLRDGQLSGQLVGQTLLGSLHPAAGSRPAPGVYRLMPPVDDPVFGVVVTALPLRQTAGTLQYVLKDVYVTSVHRSGAPSGSFVISGKHLPGVDSQVMRVGFDALVAALQSSSGCELTISV